MSRIRLLTVMLTGIIAFALSCVKPVDDSTSSNTEGETSIELSEEEQEVYLARGKEIAQGTFEALSAELTQAMSEGGVEEAIKYCNVSAMPLTDSLSKVYHATVRRTALRYRNPENKPTEEETKILNDYSLEASENLKMEPIVEPLDENHIVFYAPIMTKGLCLTCHGTQGQSLSEETYETIQTLYPEDEATGFAMGDLRGMWSITFERESDSPRQTGIINLNTDAYLAEMKKFEHPILIDARTPAEFTTGHIEGAMNIDVKSSEFKEQISKLDKDAVYFVNCRSGIRSTRACKIMEEQGFKYLYNLDGGMLEWQKEGKPVVKVN